MINYSIWCFWSLFHLFHSNVPGNKCHRQKWRVLLFTRIKLVARVLACARAIAYIKLRRLYYKKKVWRETTGVLFNFVLYVCDWLVFSGSDFFLTSLLIQKNKLHEDFNKEYLEKFGYKYQKSNSLKQRIKRLVPNK